MRLGSTVIPRINKIGINRLSKALCFPVARYSDIRPSGHVEIRFPKAFRLFGPIAIGKLPDSVKTLAVFGNHGILRRFCSICICAPGRMRRDTVNRCNFNRFPVTGLMETLISVHLQILTNFVIFTIFSRENPLNIFIIPYAGKACTGFPVLKRKFHFSDLFFTPGQPLLSCRFPMQENAAFSRVPGVRKSKFTGIVFSRNVPAKERTGIPKKT